MAETDMKLTKFTYRTLLYAVKKKGWTCKNDDNNLSINYGVNGDNLHMDFDVSIDAERQLVRLVSKLPLKFDIKQIVAGAITTCLANYKLSDGSFDLDTTCGNVMYRMTTSYRDCYLSAEALIYLMDYSAWAIDKFYAPLQAVANGKMDAVQFYEKFMKD